MGHLGDLSWIASAWEEGGRNIKINDVICYESSVHAYVRVLVHVCAFMCVAQSYIMPA